jgi:hypothetical protein
LLAVLAACSGKKKLPEADPAQVVAALKQAVKSFPGPGMTACKDHEVVGGATMTAVTFFHITGFDYKEAKPEYQAYVNPPELDSPAARVLADAKASPQAKRQAAAELLAAPFYLIYHVDLVNAPMALQVKELKRGTVNARAIRFDKQGNVVCVRVFAWQNDKAVSDSAIKRSNKAQIDPAIAKELQDDLRVQYLERVKVLSLPQAKAEPMERIPDGFGN